MAERVDDLQRGKNLLEELEYVRWLERAKTRLASKTQGPRRTFSIANR